jgi:AAA family ATP:ADP antiporter
MLLLNATVDAAGEYMLGSIDYSLSNTVRNMLFLPCTPEEKYSAKQAIDSFFFRMGDVVSAAMVFGGTYAGLSAAGLLLVLFRQ